VEGWLMGYVHVYTGNGKGKSTAAFGLALRAAGADMNVFIAQFVKGMKYSELNSIKKLSENITIKQYGRNCFVKNKPEEEDVILAAAGLAETKEAVSSGKYQVVVMDEANIAIHYKLFSVSKLLETIDSMSENTELVITGRYAEPRIIERADLVTEMVEIKHYYTAGVKARRGIEK